MGGQCVGGVASHPEQGEQGDGQCERREGASLNMQQLNVRAVPPPSLGLMVSHTSHRAVLPHTHPAQRARVCARDTATERVCVCVRCVCVCILRGGR